MGHYLVTGVAGFIASRVAERLLAEGNTVTGIDNLNDAYDVRLKQWRLEQIRTLRGFRFEQMDIRDRDALRALFLAQESADTGSFDAVINLAARAGVRYSVVDPWIYVDTNVMGTLNLLDSCREFDVRKFVLSSTSSLYANSPVPYSEDTDTNHPLSPYAASKKGAEALCYSYHHLYAIDVTVFRYFTVYGPAGRPDMMPLRFVQWISEGRPVLLYGDGSQSRDFTYVDDIARGTIAGLKSVGYEVINLGSDTPVSIMEAIRVFERLIGRPAELTLRPRHAADVDATWADIGKAERVLGWRPEVGFEEGLSRLVSWYQSNREWARNLDMGV